MNREEKIAYVETLKEGLSSAQIVLRTRFTGLSVSRMTELRKNLRDAGVRYRVVKNTLLRRAVEGTEYESLVEDLKGPIALAYSSEDVVGVAKTLTDFAKDEELFLVENGVLSGKALSAADVVSLASLPSKDQLRGQFLSVLQSVPRNLLGVMQAPSRDLLGVLNARKDSLEDAA